MSLASFLSRSTPSAGTFLAFLAPTSTAEANETSARASTALRGSTFFEHAGALMTADGSDDHLIKLEGGGRQELHLLSEWVEEIIHMHMYIRVHRHMSHSERSRDKRRVVVRDLPAADPRHSPDRDGRVANFANFLSFDALFSPGLISKYTYITFASAPSASAPDSMSA